MPVYIYKHPEEEEYVEILQGMNDEHVYEQDGLAWERVFLAPNASIDSQVDPFSSRQFVDTTAQKKGTVGDLLDYSAELSHERAQKSGGKDPVKEKYYKNYSASRKGAMHPKQIREKGYESKNVKIEYD
jgi:Ni/Co efflux regulator RcnB